MADEIELSIVVPLLNEEEVFAALVSRLQNVMNLATFACEAVLVDDGSSDQTPKLIERICAEDSRFRGVLLTRNFGHQHALSAGLEHARGNCIGVVDGDLQDPPETLLEFHDKLDEGFDVVYAIRQKRKESWPKRFCYWLFYRLLKQIATVDIPLDAGDFCLMRRRVVREIIAMPERQRFLRGMRCWIGMRQVGVTYERQSREQGESKYSLAKLMLLALDGLLTFSEIPLRLATACGALIASTAFVWGLYIFFWRLFGDASELAGFATLGCGVLFLGGVQMIFLGIQGEYIARIHNEVKQRPIYIIDKLVGGDDPTVIAPNAAEPAVETVPDLATILGSPGQVSIDSCIAAVEDYQASFTTDTL